MKVIGINGSARKEGNTAIAIRRVFSVLEKEGIETELIQLAGKPVTGCMACYGCFKVWINSALIIKILSMNVLKK